MSRGGEPESCRGGRRFRRALARMKGEGEKKEGQGLGRKKTIEEGKRISRKNNKGG